MLEQKFNSEGATNKEWQRELASRASCQSATANDGGDGPSVMRSRPSLAAGNGSETFILSHFSETGPFNSPRLHSIMTSAAPRNAPEPRSHFPFLTVW